MASSSAHQRSFLKWAGNKHTLLPRIVPQLWAEAEVYVEPFLGSGVVFLNAPRYPHYVLGDSNPDVIACCQHVQQHLSALIDCLTPLFTKETNSPQEFYRLRQLFNQTPSGSLERSALFIYLNRHSFNGLCRYNQRGLFNVPFGQYAAPRLPLAELTAFHRRCLDAQITWVIGPYSKTLQVAETFRSSCIYADPPYAPLSSTANFTAYHTAAWDSADQAQLATELSALWLKHKKSKLLVSNHDTEFIRACYTTAGATVQSFPVKRTIAAKGSSRTPVLELLAQWDSTQTAPTN